MSHLSPIILHIPHASPFIPLEYRNQFALSDDALRSELLKMTDWYTQDLFPSREITSIIASVSRLLVDVERFRDDEDECMSRVGMGAIYTQCADGSPLRQVVSEEQREELLRLYYDQHHDLLSRSCEKSLADFSYCCMIDCHSFPEKAQPYEMIANKDLARPDICLGADDYHTPQELIDCTQTLFQSYGYTVCVNEPFVGSLVPLKFYHKDKRVKSMMIEINRKLYMNECTGEKLANFPIIQTHISDVIRQIAKFDASAF